MIRTIEEVYKLNSFEERFDYLKLNGEVGSSTFGFDRYLNQKLYGSVEWKRIRDIVIIRDNGCDLGVEDRPIFDRIIIHHMNPIRIEDIERRNLDILNPDYLITVSVTTHRALHYSNLSLVSSKYIERKRGDTKLW